jgi:succinate dehydrogenase hydrophobic anchor subunit
MRHRENVTSGGAVLWLFQRVTGVYLAVVLLAHQWQLHYKQI